MATDQKPQKNHDAILTTMTSPEYQFIVVNVAFVWFIAVFDPLPLKVYKLQFFTFMFAVLLPV